MYSIYSDFICMILKNQAFYSLFIRVYLSFAKKQISIYNIPNPRKKHNH